jgi:hypothetical protein
MTALELQGYIWRSRITSNRSKLQRPDRVTVCSHSAMDATANVGTTLSISHTSNPVKIASCLNIDKDCRGRAPQIIRIVMKYAGIGGNAGGTVFLQSNTSLCPWQHIDNICSVTYLHRRSRRAAGRYRNSPRK